ncbi:hypothetical protein ES703_51639 [subsurface metagenome]
MILFRAWRRSNVIFCDAHLYRDTFQPGHFCRHLKIHDITAVVAKDIEDASSAVYFPGCREHILGAGRGKYVAYGNAIEQTRADITEKDRYVA